MHHIEPYYNWHQYYVAAEDEDSPFYGRQYSEFEYSNKIYNYFIHPQWDYFGSETLYMKILYVNYDKSVAIIELLGEWNDCLANDIMLLKRNIVDELLPKGIYKYLLIGDNVLNFHSSDDCYYEEWYEDVVESNGWIATINFREHVVEEMEENYLYNYLNFGCHLNIPNWRVLKPLQLVTRVEQLLNNQQRLLM